MSELAPAKPKVKTRSTAYPNISLEEAIKAVTDLRHAMGKGPYSRESAAQGMGHSGLSGAGAAKVAALVHYGLLERQGNTYRQTDLAETIINPLNDDEKDEGLRRAAATPKLLQHILSDFQGQSLPQRLDAILARTYGISDKAAPAVAKITTSSLEYAGLLKSGVIDGEAGSLPVPEHQRARADGRPIGWAHSQTKESPLIQHIILPKSGITVIFPASVNYRLAMGEFAATLKSLDNEASTPMADDQPGTPESPKEKD